MIAMVRDQIGAFAYFRNVVVVKRLPKTRSGKILRSTMRKIANNELDAIPSTIDDATIPGEIADSLSLIGNAVKKNILKI
jgi:propionyl-CoA synthetase